MGNAVRTICALGFYLAAVVAPNVLIDRYGIVDVPGIGYQRGVAASLNRTAATVSAALA